MNERIMQWAGHSRRVPLPLGGPPDIPVRFQDITVIRLTDYPPPSYDTDITLWHGPDGLLAKIEEKGLQFRDAFILSFLDRHEYPDSLDPDDSLAVDTASVWAGLTATPAQLAAALVKVIEEES